MCERVKHDGTATSRLASDGDFARITAKLGYVRLHPLHGEVLVQKTGVDDTIAAHLV